MTFAKRLRDGVRRGDITLSVRIWQRPDVRSVRTGLTLVGSRVSTRWLLPVIHALLGIQLEIVTSSGPAFAVGAAVRLEW